MPEHFNRPSGSSKWHVRLVAPKHVRPLVEQKEFRKSTGHSDLMRAKVVGHALITDKLREWDTLSRSVGADGDNAAPTALTADLVEQICAKRLYSWMRSDDEDRASPEGLSAEALADIESFCMLSDVAMRSVFAQGAASAHWHDVVESALDWCNVLGYAVETADPLFIRLARSFASVEKDAQRLIAQRNAGEDAKTPSPPQSVRHVLSDVTEPFREYKSPKAANKYVGTMLNAWTLLIEHCGDIPLDSVTPGLIFGFMEARLHATSKAWSEGRERTRLRRVRTQSLCNASRRTRWAVARLRPRDVGRSRLAGLNVPIATFLR